MIKLGKFTYNEDEVLSCINFMKNSDVIFSGTLSEEDFLKCNFKEPKIIHKENNLITFINLEIEIEENDIVYCQLDYLEVLFRLIKKLNFSNIKIVSTQADRKINKRLFDKKPSCISKWYSINVDYKHPQLISIPLGIASYRNTKSVIFSDFSDPLINNDINQTFYTNFNINTNYFHRIKAQKSIINFLGQNVMENIDYSSYLANLRSSVYCIAPWGNGYDTHRFWESLYSETIPITMVCTHYESFSDLPVMLVNSYEEIKTIQKEYDFFEKNIEKLNINWWISEIKNHVIEYSSPVRLRLTKAEVRFLDYYITKLNYRNKLIKMVFTFLRRVDKKINNLHKI